MGRIIKQGSYRIENGRVRGQLPPKVDARGQVNMYGLVGTLRRCKDSSGMVMWSVVSH